MPSKVKITAILVAKAGKNDDLSKLLEEMAPHCRAEPGNLRWDVWQDQSQHDRYVLDELYVDSDAAAAHRKTLHYDAYLSRVPDLADRVAVTCDPLWVDYRCT